MKTTFKSVIVSIILVCMVVVILTAVDNAHDMTDTLPKTSIKVKVVDLENNPLHNAQIDICGQTFYTDNNGNTPTIQIDQPVNCYDASISSWSTTTVVITKKNCVPTVVLNCVIFDSETRKLTVKVYRQDESNLPYVCYVETPPDEYLKSLLTTQSK